MICENCKKKIGSGAMFCSNCGKAVASDTLKTRRKMVIIIAICSVVLLATIAIAAIFMVKGGKSFRGENETNVGETTGLGNNSGNNEIMESSKDTEVFDEQKEELAIDWDSVELLSEASPILGYWQSEKAGMYIEYQAQGEGFTVFLHRQDADECIMCDKVWDISDKGNGNIEIYSDFEEEFECRLQVDDIDHLVLSITDQHKDEEGEFYTDEYKFHRDEIKKELFDPFLGEWQGMCVLDDSFENISVSYDTGRNSIYTSDHERGSRIVLYDGESVHCVYSGIEGSYYEYKTPIYGGMIFNLDGDLLKIHGYQKEGGPYDEILCRKGSSKVQAIKAFIAYKDYLEEERAEYDDDYYEDSCYKFIFLDNDDVPEMVENGIGSMFLYHINDSGDVEKEILSPSYASDFAYKERTGEYIVKNSYGNVSYESEEVFSNKLENGRIDWENESLLASYSIDKEEDRTEYQLNGRDVDEYEYKKGIEDLYGRYTEKNTEDNMYSELYIALEECLEKL